MVLLVSLRVLKFGRELDPYQSPVETRESRGKNQPPSLFDPPAEWLRHWNQIE
jgi:hypothetical protein